MAAEVEFPELRARMMVAVDALAAEPYEPGQNAWGESQFSGIFDVLCEQLELDQIDARGAVGYFLTSEDEGRALAELASALQSVCDETKKYASDPSSLTDEEVQRAQSWPKAIASARRAQDALLR
jgi:hypothetical protein